MSPGSETWVPEARGEQCHTIACRRDDDGGGRLIGFDRVETFKQVGVVPGQRAAGSILVLSEWVTETAGVSVSFEGLVRGVEAGSTPDDDWRGSENSPVEDLGREEGYRQGEKVRVPGKREAVGVRWLTGRLGGSVRTDRESRWTD